jgi:2,3-bisphosphoglycerate-independent phosphoglycerate mutase
MHEPELAADLRLTPGVSYRNILLDVSGNRPGAEARNYGALVTAPPHEIPRRPWIEHLPTPRSGSGAAGELAGDILRRLMELARVYLPTHPVNAARIAAGKRPANMAWIWGQGVRPDMPTFEQKFGLRGAMTTAVDLLAGIATLIGWDRLDVPGVSSYHDNNYAGQGRATCAALGEYDIVCCHVESPDECAHQGDWKTKVAAMEAIDLHVIGPVVERLRAFGDPEKEPDAEGWRLLFMPDHYTLCSTRKHDNTPVPVLIAGSWVRSAVQRPYGEKAALESDLSVEPGDQLIEYFLRGGLARVATRVR